MTLEQGFGLCVFDEQGTGKTVTTIFAFDTLVGRDEVDIVLIVAPKSMVSEWPHDFARFMADRYSVSVVSGSRGEKWDSLASDADVLVTNFETVVTMEAEIRNLLTRYCDRAMFVVDESFFTKNLDAQRTVAVRRLREWCGRAYVLCGTPAPNKPHDLIEQFNIVDFGLTFAGVSLPEDRTTARPLVRQAINDRGLYIRHRKTDVLADLPSKTFNRVLIPLEPVQEMLYRDASQGLIRDLRAIDDDTFSRQIANFLARRTALLQICSNPVSVSEGYDEVPAKLLAMDDLLARFIEEQREKVIIWSFYTTSIEGVLARYQRYCPVRYDGKVRDVDVRRAAVDRFQNDDQTMLFVGNPAAAGAGLTLHRARLAIYESM